MGHWPVLPRPEHSVSFLQCNPVLEKYKSLWTCQTTDGYRQHGEVPCSYDVGEWTWQENDNANHHMTWGIVMMMMMMMRRMRQPIQLLGDVFWRTWTVGLRSWCFRPPSCDIQTLCSPISWSPLKENYLNLWKLDITIEFTWSISFKTIFSCNDTHRPNELIIYIYKHAVGVPWCHSPYHSSAPRALNFSSGETGLASDRWPQKVDFRTAWWCSAKTAQPTAWPRECAKSTWKL